LAFNTGQFRGFDIKIQIAGPALRLSLFNGNQSIEAEFNVYNTLNVNTITAQNNRAGASTYLQPTEIIAPRVMRVGVKYRF
jgi:hypothetical protein